MLKGHVFKRQVFGNQVFALFINTFLNGKNGISDNYGNGMKPTYSGSNVTIDNGAVCIQGRFLEEDTSTTISAGTDSAYCILVIEINLDDENTDTEFTQASYKIVKGTSSYPTLTQSNIVKNNAGIYQYEVARFRTSASGISDFKDTRTFLDFDSIYSEIDEEYKSILEELKKELASVEDGSAYMLSSKLIYKYYTGISEGFVSVPVPDVDREYMALQVDVQNETGTWTPTKDYSVTGKFLDLNTSANYTAMRICWLDITASGS